jgi:O-antigen ligase
MIIYYIFFTFKFIKAKFIISIFIATSLLYFNIGDVKILNSLSAPSSKADITSGRAYLWMKSLNTFEQSDNKYKIFGYGFGQYPQAINLFGFNSVSFQVLDSDFESFNEKDKNSRIHAHNPFFNVLIENGIAGFLLYSFMYILIIKLINKNQKSGYKDYYLALFIIFLSGSFTSISYMNSPLMWILLFLSKNQIHYDYRSIRNSGSREVIGD